jgi:MFS transporter, ACS family, glucarate transporter
MKPLALRPSRVRYGVLGFACALSMITYLDRVCFGSAVKHIIEDLGLESEADLKWAFWGFAFSYAAFEIPTGWLGDLFGPRRTLIRIVLWWSLFTVLTGLVWKTGFLILSGIGLLIAIRFLFGMGEAGAYPNITRALHNWFPVGERAGAQGAVWMAGRLMGGLTPLVWMFVVERGGLSWRVAFFIFGGIGVVWCVAFAAWFRNRPDEKPETNEAERALIAAGREPEADHFHVPWMRLLLSRNLWALCLMYFCGAFAWYFNITYLHNYLDLRFAVDKTSVLGAIYKGGPLWMGAITCLLGGWLSDRFIRATGNRRWGRRLFGLIGYTACGICFVATMFTETLFTFFLAISLAAFWNDLTMGAAWATCQDIGRRYAAIVAGCMNTVGNLGGAAAGLVTGYILDEALHAKAQALGISVEALARPELAPEKLAALLPAYQINFGIFAAVCFVALLFWLRIDATEPIVPGATIGEQPQIGAGPAPIPPITP